MDNSEVVKGIKQYASSRRGSWREKINAGMKIHFMTTFYQNSSSFLMLQLIFHQKTNRN